VAGGSDRQYGRSKRSLAFAVPPNAYQLLPYVVAVLPLALAALASAFWWNALTRPWIFFAVGAAALYGAL